MKPRPKRIRCTTSVGLIQGARRDIAFVEDVSQGGMKLRGVPAPKKGDILRLHAKGCVFSAQVRWVRGALCGVQFLADKDMGEIRRFLAVCMGARRGRSGTPPMLEIVPNNLRAAEACSG